MGINKVQVGLIALINALSSIYSYICLSDYGIVYHSFTSDPSKIWLSLIFMGVMSGLVAIYFALMTMYGIVCTCLTGDSSNQKPSFSLCGCFSLLAYFSSYLWGWMLYLSVSESVKNLTIWSAFVFQLYTPIVIIGTCFLFFILRSLCKQDKKTDQYIRHHDELNP